MGERKAKVTIRPIKPGDEARCAAIMSRAMRQAFHWAHVPDTDVASFRAATTGETVLVAETNGLVVGFAAIYDPGCFLHHLYVDTDAQGAGIGKALLAEAIRSAGPSLSLKCQVRNDKARRFYRACGWVEDEAPGGEDEYGAWLMIRATRHGS